MTEEIGLLADLDLTQWDLAVSRYMQSIDDMKRAAEGIAGGVSSGFSGLDLSLSGVASGITNTFLGIGETVFNALTDLARQIYENYQELGKNLLFAVTGFTTAIVGAVTLAGKGLVDWTVEGISQNTAFEQSLSDIAAVLRTTRDAVTPLGEEINTLALDPNLVISTEQASSVVEQLARNGLDMTQILDGAAKSSVLLANAVGSNDPASFAQAADIATMAMQEFNLKASDMAHVADVSQGVINGSRLELNDWALALGNGGAAAGAFNVKLDDFATAIAGTVNLYHTARQAGTGLTNFLERLVPLTKPAAEEMRKLGLFSGETGAEFDKTAGAIDGVQNSITQLDPTSKNYQKDLTALQTKLNNLNSELNKGSNAFFDAKGNLKDLADVSQILQNATKNLSDEQKVEAYRIIFGNNALETAIGFANLGADAFNKLKDTVVQNGSAAESAATRTKTLAARWENLRDIWSAIQRQSGAGFNDMLLKLVNLMTELTNTNQDRIISFFGELAKVFGSLVEAALPWVEKMLPVLLDNIEALAHWLLEIVKSGNPFNEWLSRMSPWLKGFVEGIISIVDQGKKFIAWLVDTGKYIWMMMSPYIEWIKNNIKLKDVLIAAAGAIAAYVLPAILRMVSIANLAIGAVAAIRRAWETDWLNIRTFFETVWPKIEQPLFDFINNFLTGKWGAAWDDAVTIVSIAVSTIVDLLNKFGSPLAVFIADILQGKWKDAWTIAVQWVSDRLEDLKSYLPGWANDFISVIQDLLTGNWQKAWNDAVAFVQDSIFSIGDLIKELNAPLAGFIADILQGKWVSAWNDAKAIAYSVYTDIVRWLLDLHTPFTNFIALVLQGDWKDAWTIAQAWVIEQLNKIKDYIPSWAANVISIVQNLLKGDWATAWTDAANTTRLVYDSITQWLLDLNTPFSNFIALILEGQWKNAWTIAQQWAISQLEAVKAYLPNWGSDFISVVEGILTGNWQTVWENAKKIVTDIFFGIGEAVRGLNTPFTTFISDVLEGKWDKAWIEAKAILGLTDDKITLIVDGVQALGLVLGALAIGSLADIITGFISWISGIVIATIDIVPFIVQVGLLAAAIYLLTTPVNDIISGLQNFQNKMLDLVNDTSFPVWLRSLFSATVAAAAAFEEWTRVLGLWKGQADISLGPDSGILGWKDTLKDLGTNIREISEFFELAGLEVEYFTLKYQEFIGAMQGQTVFDAQEKRIQEIQDRIAKLRILLASGFWGGDNTVGGDVGTVTVPTAKPGSVPPSMFANVFTYDAATAQKNLDAITTKMQELHDQLNIHYLSLDEVAKLSGINSVTDFSQAFVGSNSQDAQANVLIFVNKIAELAAAIKDGFYTAGDKSVGLYVQALADKSGIAEDSAFKLANTIVKTFGTNLTDIGGLVVPDTYQKTIIDPITGLTVPATQAGQQVGQSSVDGVTQGIGDGKGGFLDSVQGIIDNATTVYNTLIPASKDTGTQSVGALGQATTDNQNAAINPMQSLIDQANKTVATLTPASGQTGKDSVTALGTSVDQNKQPTLDTVQSLISSINDKSTPMIQNMGDVGNASSDALIQPYIQVAPGQMQGALEGLNTVIYTWATALIQYMNDSGKSSSLAFSIGIAQNKDQVVSSADLIGKLFRDKINDYLTIVINNFVNLADNIKSLTDFQKFTDLGTNIGDALKSGLDSKLADVQASGAALVAAAATGVTTTAQIASPSKLFEKFADFIREGFNIGLNKPLDGISGISSRMVDGASANLNAQLSQRTGTVNPVSSTSNYNNSSSAVTIINNIYNQMDQAQLQYMMQQTLNGVGLV